MDHGHAGDGERSVATIRGRLGAVPSIVTANREAVIEFVLKVEKQEFSCRATGETAIDIHTHAKPDLPMTVSGPLREEVWQTHGGSRRSRVYLSVDTVQYHDMPHIADID